MIHVKLKLFGALRKLACEEELWIEIRENGTVADLQREVGKHLAEGAADPSAVARLLGESVLASEFRILGPADSLQDGEKVSALPPVCGG